MKKITEKVLIIGLYAVICHVCGILLYYNINSSSLPHELLVSRCAEMLEYSLMSIIIICVGCLLLDRVKKSESST